MTCPMQDKEERERRARQTQRRRQRWRELSAAEKELDWQRYGKYDALQQLLQSAADDPSFKVPPQLSYPCQPCYQEGTVLGTPISAVALGNLLDPVRVDVVL